MSSAEFDKGIAAALRVAERPVQVGVEKGLALGLRAAYRGLKAFGGDMREMVRLKLASEKLRSAGDIRGAQKFDDAIKRWERGDVEALDQLGRFKILSKPPGRAKFDALMRD